MTQYSIEPRTRKYVKGYEFLSFARKYKKELLDTRLKSGANRSSMSYNTLYEIT